MKVLIVTFGSRGDVQPYVALGGALQEKGYAVTLCTAEQYADFVRQFDLGYARMSGELLRLMDSEAGREAMEETVGPLGSLKTMATLARQTNPLNRQMMLDSWAAAQEVEPEIVIYHPKALGALSIAEAFGASPIMAVLQPMIVPTAAFPAPSMPRLSLGGWYNKLSYKAVSAGYAMYRGMVNEIRRQEMGMEEVPRGTGLLRTAAGDPVPVLHGFSPTVVPRPDDWPPGAHITGYWFLRQREPYQPPPELAAFLEAGDSPVYVGFGSMAGKDPARLTQIVIDGLQLAGRRGILASGWGGLAAESLPGSVLQIEGAPHGWLFPRVAAVVHHGGAGTTAAGLLAGRPTLICPFMGDQPFWGERVRHLGAGPEPIPQKRLTAEKLAAAVREMLDEPAMRQKAAVVGQQIQAEDGLAKAAKVVEDAAFACRLSP